MTDRSRLLADNRANWDERARVHTASGYGMQELVDDPARITQEVAQDRERLGDLHGLDVVHLQCHLGTDTVSLARLGARRVVGLDMSPASLEGARGLASRCGADIEFVEADVYDARAAVTGDADLVYTSLGVLCWLPDIAGWAQVVASLLRPGGRLLLRDDHPVFMAVDEDVSEGLRLTQPYFETDRPQTWDSEHSYVETPPGTAPLAHTRSHEWNHSIGEIISAVLAAGLVLDGFEETQSAAWCPWPELMERTPEGTWRLRDAPERLPLQYVLTAHRPA